MYEMQGPWPGLSSPACRLPGGLAATRPAAAGSRHPAGSAGFPALPASGGCPGSVPAFSS